MTGRRRTATSCLHGIAVLMAVGCQWITGAKERTLVADGPPCSSSSECDGGVCLFDGCRTVCSNDGECPMGWRCLQTAEGAPACVREEALTCGGIDSCPKGTQCFENKCRKTCEFGSFPCIDGYACVGSVCIDHATLEAGTTEAASGAGGANPAGGAGGGGGSATGGAAGAPRDAGQMLADASEGGATGPCGNGKRDGTETDIDCGGSACPKCDDGLTCKVNTDCDFGTCGTDHKCGPLPWTFSGACYILLVRNGMIVESQSSPESVDCDPQLPAVRLRLNDKILVYARNPPDHAVNGNADFGPIYYYSRCAAALTTRQQLLAELNNPNSWDMSMELPMIPFFVLSKACPTAAVYKF